MRKQGDPRPGLAFMLLGIPFATIGALLGWLIGRVLGIGMEGTLRIEIGLGVACFFVGLHASLYRAIRVPTPDGRRVPLSAFWVLVSVALSVTASLANLFIPCENGLEQVLLSGLAGSGGVLLGAIPLSVHEKLVIRRERSPGVRISLIALAAFILLFVLGTPALALISQQKHLPLAVGVHGKIHRAP